MAYLPTHLTRHELLTAAERAYLDGLDLPTRTGVQMLKALTEAVLASRVDFYSSDPGAPHWKTAALILYPSRNKIGQDGLGQAVYDEEMAFLRNCDRPEEALKLLIDAEELGRKWRGEQVKPLITTADKLPARTSDRAAHHYHVAASLDCQQQTGHTYSDLYKLK